MLATCDAILNWLQLSQLSDPDMNYGIVIGPPILPLWILLFVFTVIRSMGYVLEVVNSLTVFLYDGQTKLSVVREQLLVILVSVIPLSALNFLICKNRNTYTSPLFTLCGTSSIVYIFVRFMWYAHMEGKKLAKKDDGYKISKGLFMLLCCLYAVSMSFPVMCWRHSQGSYLRDGYIYPVNIYLLKAPFLDNYKLDNYSLNHILEVHGRPLSEPYLVNNIARIVNSGSQGLYVTYVCGNTLSTRNATFELPMCEQGGVVIFRFLYNDHFNACPYGSIAYNYAWLDMESAPIEVPNDVTCVPSNHEFHGGWRLHYFRTVFAVRNRTRYAYVYSPWKGTATTPRPMYDASIPLCKVIETYTEVNTISSSTTW